MEDWKEASASGRQFFETSFDLVVLDEAQRIKNPESLRARVLSSALIPRRWALTGTPLENRLTDLGSILRFLSPNELPDLDSLKDAETVLRLSSRLLLRRRKAEVLTDLPPRLESQTYVELAPAQRDEYAAGLELLHKQRDIGDLMATLQRLRQICAIATGSGESGKLDFLEEEVSEAVASGEKVVIFTSFPNTVIPALISRLGHLGVACIHGSMDLPERDREHRRFVEDPTCNLMLASLTAAGVGYTWTVSRLVYHFDLWWNPQVTRQASDRVHRIGQESPVLIKHLVAQGTIEEDILDLLQQKQDLFDAVITASETEPVSQHAVAQAVLDRLLAT